MVGVQRAVDLVFEVVGQVLAVADQMCIRDRFGILLALLFMPSSTLWGRAIFAFLAAIAGTWIFVWFIQRIPVSYTHLFP